MSAVSILEPIISVGINDLVVFVPSKLTLYICADPSTLFLTDTSPKNIVPAGESKDLIKLLYSLILLPTLIKYEKS